MRQVHDLCSPEFWKMFATVRQETSECTNKVLRATRDVLKKQKCNFVLGHRWPSSVRSLRNRVDTKAGNFWDHVTYSHTVHFAGGKFAPVRFSFVDPCYVWVQQCVSLHDNNKDLQFVPKVLRHANTDEETYGAGIQFGLLFRAACSSIPTGGVVALMNLSWDGGDTGIGSRSASPICLQVMNTNCGSLHGIGLVGYIPKIEVSGARRTQDDYKKASAHLLQV